MGGVTTAGFGVDYVVLIGFIVVLLLLYIAWRVTPSHSPIGSLSQKESVEVVESALGQWKKENPNHWALSQNDNEI